MMSQLIALIAPPSIQRRQIVDYHCHVEPFDCAQDERSSTPSPNVALNAMRFFTSFRMTWLSNWISSPL
jgi:hypothetical protein